MLLSELLGREVVNRHNRNTVGLVIGVERHRLPLITVRSHVGYDHGLGIQDLDFVGDSPRTKVIDVIIDLFEEVVT